MQFYIYRTAYTGATPPFDIVRVNVFNGIPSNPASISVFGDDTSNRFVSGTDSQIYRIFNSSVPAPGTVPGTTKANVITTLNPGTYWVKYQFADAAMNPGFAPSVTIPGSRGLPTFNAVQYQGAVTGWVRIIDAGNPATAPDFTIDMPFIITYTAVAVGYCRNQTNG